MNPVVEKHQSAINVIAHCIENDMQGMKNILKRNGVDTSVIRTKNALRKAFINALAKSKAVALDFNRYIEAKKKASVSANANGEGMFSNNLNLDDLKLDTTLDNPFTSGKSDPFDPKTYSTYGNGNDVMATTTPTMPTQNGGFFSGLNLADLINTGVSILEIQRDIKLSNDNKEAVENAVQIKQDEINLQPQKAGTSTGVWIAVGLVGVALVGGLIYVATKKK